MQALSESMNKRKQEFVEKVGVFFEEKGLTPISARVVGYLIIAEPHYQSFYQLTGILQVSKGAISNALNSLLQKEYIQCVTFTGDRKRYFKVNTNTWLNFLKTRYSFFGEMRHLLDESLEIRSNEQKEFNHDLGEIRELYGVFEKELPKIISNWERNRKND